MPWRMLDDWVRLVRHYLERTYLFTALDPNRIGAFNKGLDKSPRFV